MVHYRAGLETTGTDPRRHQVDARRGGPGGHHPQGHLRARRGAARLLLQPLRDQGRGGGDRGAPGSRGGGPRPRPPRAGHRRGPGGGVHPLHRRPAGPGPHLRATRRGGQRRRPSPAGPHPAPPRQPPRPLRRRNGAVPAGADTGGGAAGGPSSWSPPCRASPSGSCSTRRSTSPPTPATCWPAWWARGREVSRRRETRLSPAAAGETRRRRRGGSESRRRPLPTFGPR